MKKFLTTALLIGSILLTGCGGQGASGDEVKSGMIVYTSIYPLYDFTSKIAGDKATVKLLVPDGTEPHDWEPGTQEMNDLEKADVFIYNGAGLESWTDKVLSSLDNKDLTVVEASKGLDIMKGHDHHDEGEEASEEDHGVDAVHDHEHEDGEDHEHHHDHGGLDPHVWLSPMNAKKEARNILEGLTAKDPENKAFYEKNYEELAKKFDDLDKAYREALKDVKKRDIVVAHEAFGYMCKDYSLKQIGIEGVNSEHEPDPKTMAKIVDMVKEKGITTIFSETLIDPKVSEAIAKETGARVAVLNPVEGLTKEDREKGADYFSIMEDNLKALTEALKND